jgi:hypothetical protein
MGRAPPGGPSVIGCQSNSCREPPDLSSHSSNGKANPDLASAALGQKSRSRAGAVTAIIGWIMFGAGIAAVLLDSTLGLPWAMAWAGYTAAAGGAGLFAWSCVLRSPKCPPFLDGEADPWGRGV